MSVKLVRRAHPQTGIDLTYIKQSGESNGSAGDEYTLPSKMKNLGISRPK